MKNCEKVVPKSCPLFSMFFLVFFDDLGATFGAFLGTFGG